MSEMTEDEFLATLRVDFLNEAIFLLAKCEEACLALEASPDPTHELALMFRLMHTVKGSGATAGFADLAGFAHVYEDCLSQLRQVPAYVNGVVVTHLLAGVDALRGRVESLRQGDDRPWEAAELAAILGSVARHEAPRPTAAPFRAAAGDFGLFDEEPSPAVPAPAIDPQLSARRQEAPHGQARARGGESHEATDGNGRGKDVGHVVKVDADRVDGILNTVSELVVIKSQLLNRAGVYLQDQTLNAVVNLLDTTVRDLQDKALGIRMTSVHPIFVKLQRLCRDLAIKLGKDVSLVTEGEDTELDRGVVDLMADPLMHILRNGMDHGMESPAERVASGKPARGTIRVMAQQLGGRVMIRVCDDGRGIDREKVLRRGRERGLVPEGAQLGEKEIYALLFEPGFSTAAVVSEVSGRGVGLDVVKTNVESLKGSVDVSSVPGSGTSFTISLPLTTAITEGLLVAVGEQPYVLPMDGIKEVVRVDPAAVTAVSRTRETLTIRDRIFPVMDLRARLAGCASGAAGAKEVAIVVEHADGPLALKVDAIHGQVQIVQKPLTEASEAKPWISGAGILGDGRAVLVLDVNVLAKAVERDRRFPHSA